MIIKLEKSDNRVAANQTPRKISEIIPVLVQSLRTRGGNGVNTGLYKRLGGSDGNSVEMGSTCLKSNTEIRILTDISKRVECHLTSFQEAFKGSTCILDCLDLSETLPTGITVWDFIV